MVFLSTGRLGAELPSSGPRAYANGERKSLCSVGQVRGPLRTRAARHPELLQGVMALCPATDPTEMFAQFPTHFLESYGGSPEEVPQVYRERTTRFLADQIYVLPTMIVHGTADEVIPVHHSRLLVEKLGAHCRYIEIEGEDHDSPTSIDGKIVREFLALVGSN